jgi:hypothetical protein
VSAGGDQLTVAARLKARAFTEVGGPGSISLGVTAVGRDAAEVPTAFVAVTVIAYG